MRIRTVTAFVVLTLIAVLQAQDVKQIFNELQANSVSAPSVATEPAPAAVVEKVAKSGVLPEDPSETVVITQEKTGQGSIKAGLISLSLKGVELNNVIRLFSELSGANIIVPELEAGVGAGKVDVNLKNVEWKPALQAILDGQNLELYEKIPGADVYSIRKKLSAADAIKNTRTFIFKHADIAQAKTVIEGVVGDRGQVYAYAQGNAIVVKTTQEVMDDVAQIAERIDTARRQVLIEARILELSDTGSKDLGVDFTQFDIMNKGKGALTLTSSTWPSTLTQAGTLTMNSADVKIAIKALQEKGNVRTVSSPKVIVANGQPASIRIVTREPVIKTTPTFSSDGNLTSILYNQEDDGTDPETQRKRYATYDYGIMLNVTPTIYSEENIAVRIVPVISRKVGDLTRYIGTTTNGLAITFPRIDEKKVDTTFMLGNKRTAVIGGLTETDDQESESKVPFLGSIPLIRHLFTYKHTETVQRENIIFVTVSLEDGQEFDVDKAVKQSPLTRKQLIRDDNNQVVDDRAVELYKAQSDSRIKDEIRVIERKEQAESHDRTLLAPLRKVLRP